MPIRFRCAHCDKLLGIARRKAGTIVNCPQCGQPLIVPTPEEEPASEVLSPDESTMQSDLKTDHDSHAVKKVKQVKPKEKLFDDVDIDQLLESGNAVKVTNAATEHHHADPTASKKSLPATSVSSTLQPLPMPAPVQTVIPTPTAVGIPIGKLIALVVIVFVLVVGAFIAGIFVGKGMQ